jgi:hypothetical protein
LNSSDTNKAPSELKGARVILDSIKQLFLMSWLWIIFAGFYLVAYSFWDPHLFPKNVLLMAASLCITLLFGFALLLDGFSRAVELQSGKVLQSIRFRREWHIVGGLALLGYVSVYVPPAGRVVAHWPLDLAITIVSGVIILFYGVTNR